MNDPLEIMALALAEAEISPDEATSISLYFVKERNMWECSVSTEELDTLEPAGIRVQVDENGARVVEMR